MINNQSIFFSTLYCLNRLLSRSIRLWAATRSTKVEVFKTQDNALELERAIVNTETEVNIYTKTTVLLSGSVHNFKYSTTFDFSQLLSSLSVIPFDLS